MVYGYLANHWLTLHGLIVMLGLAIYVAGSHTLHQRRNPSAAIAWVISLDFIALCGIAAIPGVWQPQAEVSRPASGKFEFTPRTPDPEALTARTQQLAGIMGLPEACSYQRLNIHEDGAQALQALRNMIDAAAHTIDLCTFIFARDCLGDEIARSLERRAREGIRVQIAGRRRWRLSWRTCRFQKSVCSGSPGDLVRAAFALVLAQPHQFAQSPQDGDN